jgi:hypothetical protein
MAVSFRVTGSDLDTLFELRSTTAKISDISYRNLSSDITNNFVGLINESNESNQSDESNQCNVYKCKKLVKYIKKIVNKPPIKLINKVIKHLDTTDDSLKMIIFEFEISCE